MIQEELHCKIANDKYRDWILKCWEFTGSKRNIEFRKFDSYKHWQLQFVALIHLAYVEMRGTE